MIEPGSQAMPLQEPPPAPQRPAASAELSAGQMLRRIREDHGLTIEAVAAGMKVPVQKIAALEADNIDALPDPVFARALAASVCRALRVDPAPVLAKLPGAPRAALAEADRTMGGSFRDQAPSHARSGLVGRPSRAVLAVVGLLLLGALVLLFLPQAPTEQVAATWSRMTGDEGASEPAAAAESGMVVQPSLPGAAGQPGVPPVASAPQQTAQAPQTAPAPPTQTGAAPAMPSGTFAPAGEAASPTAPAPGTVIAPAAPVAPAAPTPVSSGTLAFAARDDVWIRVSVPGGRKLMERLLKRGETVAVPDAPPLAVTVGRASAVDVQVKGQPFDLAPLTRPGGVARFEVQP